MNFTLEEKKKGEREWEEGGVYKGSGGGGRGRKGGLTKPMIPTKGPNTKVLVYTYSTAIPERFFSMTPVRFSSQRQPSRLGAQVSVALV